ncbi:hypothetical protein [Nocardioides bruguierae]|uniref:PIN domain-containing protein n=1 Tax=Nocardioides bruguierae TaxID=2945102 RepID=A0A9X2IHE9_9ACTN|nr:hypothetical protein [Nocardioides bruguierae]MCM0622539.1 hypothetical protein [Nocardioides bruguierae]
MPDPLRYTYLDTSALMRKADASASTMVARVQKMQPVLQSIFADETRVFACSELTILEFHSNITTNYRSQALPDCDYKWWLGARADLFQRIGDGQIQVLQTPPKAAEHVMSLVTLATREHGRALHAMDAMHVVIAARWAYDIGARVEILTSDTDFDAALSVTSFNDRVTFANLDVLASTGEGYDKRNQNV